MNSLMKSPYSIKEERDIAEESHLTVSFHDCTIEVVPASWLKSGRLEVGQNITLLWPTGLERNALEMVMDDDGPSVKKWSTQTATIEGVYNSQIEAKVHLGEISIKVERIRKEAIKNATIREQSSEIMKLREENRELKCEIKELRKILFLSKEESFLTSNSTNQNLSMIKNFLSTPLSSTPDTPVRTPARQYQPPFPDSSFQTPSYGTSSSKPAVAPELPHYPSEMTVSPTLIPALQMLDGAAGHFDDSMESPPVAHSNQEDEPMFRTAPSIGWVAIVPTHHIYIQEEALMGLNLKTPASTINDILNSLFSRRYMATHSLAGSTAGAQKPPLPKDVVSAIIAFVMNRFPRVTESIIKAKIREKLGNATKTISYQLTGKRPSAGEMINLYDN